MTAEPGSLAPVLITVEEAARLLAVARSHLYLHLQRGSLPSVKIGRCRRIRVSELESFVDRLQQDDYSPSAGL